MDPSKFFVTALCADTDYLSVSRSFYQRWWHSLSEKVTIEDAVGNAFDCYPEIVEGRPYLRTETTRIRRLYFIPMGGIMKLKYIGRSRFKFKIPLSSSAPVELPPVELPVDDDGADTSSDVGDEGHLQHAVDYPDSDDGGEVVDSGPGENAA